MTVWRLRKALEQFAPNAEVRVDGLDVYRVVKDGDVVRLELVYVMAGERVMAKEREGML